MNAFSIQLRQDNGSSHSMGSDLSLLPLMEAGFAEPKKLGHREMFFGHIYLLA
jgi:hypothetical protein